MHMHSITCAQVLQGSLGVLLTNQLGLLVPFSWCPSALGLDRATKRHVWPFSHANIFCTSHVGIVLGLSNLVFTLLNHWLIKR